MAYKALHDQARTRPQSNLDMVCAKHMPCVLSVTACPVSQEKRLGSTSKKMCLYPIQSIQIPSSSPLELSITCWVCWCSSFCSNCFSSSIPSVHLTGLFIKQLQTTATSASEIQPLPEQLLVTESLKYPQSISQAGQIYLFLVTLFSTVWLYVDFLLFWPFEGPTTQVPNNHREVYSFL